MSPNYNDAKKRIDEILDILEDTLFFNYINEKTTDDEGYILSDYEFFGGLYPPTNVREYIDSEKIDNIFYSSGASRTVIWEDGTSDYVLKIGNNRYCEEDNDKETSIYAEADALNAAEAFTWVKCIYPVGYEIRPGVILDRGIYAAEYIDCTYGQISDMTSTAAWLDYCSENCIDENDTTRYNKFIDEYMDMIEYEDDAILDFAIQKMWTDTLADKVKKIINKYDINDLHDGNWGLNSNGKFVIVDYAGYY